MKRWLSQRKEVWLLLLIPISFLLLFLARRSAVFAEEIFAKRIYRISSILLNRFTALFPFSVAEVGVLVLLTLFFFYLTRFLIRLLRGTVKGEKSPRLQMISNYFLHISCFLAVMLFIFVFFCGVNYERYPFSHYSGLHIQNSTKEELYELCIDLAVRTSIAREELIQTSQREEISLIDCLGDDYSITTAGLAADLSLKEQGKLAAESMDLLGKKYPVLSGAYSIPKPLMSSEFFSMTETTGIFIPFTMEANVNVACTDFTIPATMCHELSHLRGFMREDEANFIAYLACQESDHPYFRYSGLMMALVYTGNQLYRTDKELYQKARNYYSAGIIQDLSRDSAYWSPYEDTVISTAANAANDTYLKANNQSDGARSYGRMVDLLLAEYRYKKEKNHGTD